MHEFFLFSRNYRELQRKHIKEESLMKTRYKLLLVFACLALLTFSGCTDEEELRNRNRGGRLLTLPGQKKMVIK